MLVWVRWLPRPPPPLQGSPGTHATGAPPLGELTSPGGDTHPGLGLPTGELTPHPGQLTPHPGKLTPHPGHATGRRGQSKRLLGSRLSSLVPCSTFQPLESEVLARTVKKKNIERGKKRTASAQKKKQQKNSCLPDGAEAGEASMLSLRLQRRAAFACASSRVRATARKMATSGRRRRAAARSGVLRFKPA